MLIATASARRRPARVPFINPLLYWPLNETSGAIAHDLSGNGYNGTIVGSCVPSSSGLTLTANEAGVLYPGGASGSPLDVGTLTAWAIEAVVTRQGTGGSVLENIATQWRSPNFGFFTEGMHLRFTSAPFAGISDSATAMVGGPDQIANGARTHLMCIRDGGTFALYVNGSLVNTELHPATDVNNPSDGAPFCVGGGLFSAGTFPNSYGFIGKIEHVALYNVAPPPSYPAVQAAKYGV